MVLRADLVGLLRVRPNCCLFTWREPASETSGRGPKRVAVDDRHCSHCVAELSQMAPDVIVEDHRSSTGHAAEPCRVLVVDDEPDIRRELADAVREMGCEVVDAADGSEALSHLRSGAPLPRLILLDLMMPVMSGDELLEHMAADPRLATIPVVVVTARGEPPRRPAAALVHKPFRMETIGTLVDKHRPRA